MDTLLIAADADAKQIPNMELAQRIFKYEYFLVNNSAKASKMKEEILNEITKDEMGPLYKKLCTKYNWPIDQELLEKFNNKLTAEIAELDIKVADAIENAGDAEVIELMFEKARKYSKVHHHAKTWCRLFIIRTHVV
jgi:hypothetical protein